MGRIGVRGNAGTRASAMVCNFVVRNHFAIRAGAGGAAAASGERSNGRKGDTGRRFWLLGVTPLDGESQSVGVRVAVRGPAGTPYKDGLFEVLVVLNTRVSAQVTDVILMTDVYHPNLSRNTRVCHCGICSGFMPRLAVGAADIFEVVEDFWEVLKKPRVNLHDLPCGSHMNMAKNWTENMDETVRRVVSIRKKNQMGDQHWVGRLENAETVLEPRVLLGYVAELERDMAAIPGADDYATFGVPEFERMQALELAIDKPWLDSLAANLPSTARPKHDEIARDVTSFFRASVRKWKSEWYVAMQDATRVTSKGHAMPSLARTEADYFGEEYAHMAKDPCASPMPHPDFLKDELGEVEDEDLEPFYRVEALRGESGVEVFTYNPVEELLYKWEWNNHGYYLAVLDRRDVRRVNHIQRYTGYDPSRANLSAPGGLMGKVNGKTSTILDMQKVCRRLTNESIAFVSCTTVPVNWHQLHQVGHIFGGTVSRKLSAVYAIKGKYASASLSAEVESFRQFGGSNPNNMRPEFTLVGVSGQGFQVMESRGESNRSECFLTFMVHSQMYHVTIRRRDYYHVDWTEVFEKLDIEEGEEREQSQYEADHVQQQLMRYRPMLKRIFIGACSWEGTAKENVFVVTLPQWINCLDALGLLALLGPGDAGIELATQIFNEVADDNVYEGVQIGPDGNVELNMETDEFMHGLVRVSYRLHCRHFCGRDGMQVLTPAPAVKEVIDEHLLPYYGKVIGKIDSGEDELLRTIETEHVVKNFTSNAGKLVAMYVFFARLKGEAEVSKNREIRAADRKRAVLLSGEEWIPDVEGVDPEAGQSFPEDYFMTFLDWVDFCRTVKLRGRRGITFQYITFCFIMAATVDDNKATSRFEPHARILSYKKFLNGVSRLASQYSTKHALHNRLKDLEDYIFQFKPDSPAAKSRPTTPAPSTSNA